jgi:hypothetical protein
MKVFLSHSGERSRALAVDLQKVIRKLVPSADPWISTGIDKGSRWQPEIAENLEASGVGIVCITSDNLTAPWLMYEAGALSKRLDGKVCTFLLDVEASTVEAPLSQFQHTTADKADVLSLIESINKSVEAAREQPRNLEDLREQFETLWPKLGQTIETLSKESAAKPPTRKPDDMIKEVLDIVRGLARESDAGWILRQRSIRERAAIRNALAHGRLTAGEGVESAGSKSFYIGDVVEHDLFGQGVIEEVQESGNGDFYMSVRFKDAGIAIFPVDDAKLKNLTRP